MNSIITTDEDDKTLEYFDRFTPHYNPARFQFAIEYLQQHATVASRLIDIGCGDGATLYLLHQKTPVRGLWGMDISANYLRKAEGLLECRTIEGSILDDELVDQHAGTFDYCTLGAVIHHLIGRTRKQSLLFAERCVENSFRLLKPGGSLLIFEPTYHPGWMMTGAFWTKKLVTKFSSNRVEIFRSWANLGQPIVSYYTRQQIMDLVRKVRGCEIVLEADLDRQRRVGIIHRIGLGLILRRTSD